MILYIIGYYTFKVNRFYRRVEIPGDNMTAFMDGVRIVLSELHWNDVIDILVIAYIIYKLCVFIRDSRASLLVKGVLVILAAYLASIWMDLQMVSTVVEMIVRYAAIAVIVVFQPEIRSMLEKVGRSSFNVRSLFDRDEKEKLRGETLNTISSVVESTRILQKQSMGALIVFEREITLQEIIATGTKMDAAPNVPLIANIFFNKAPLHDGAMIIQNNRITAASCILPLTQNTDLDPNFGTRHRAAIGMAENSDAVVVVVSEETSRISVACNGTITSTFDPGELSAMLMDLLLPDTPGDDGDDSLRGKAAAFIRRHSAAAQPELSGNDRQEAPSEDAPAEEAAAETPASEENITAKPAAAAPKNTSYPKSKSKHGSASSKKKKGKKKGGRK